MLKIQHSKDVLALLEFLENYPDNENKEAIETQLFSVINDNPSIVVYEKFLKLYPKSNLNNNIITDLYKMYSVNLEEVKLKEFKLRHGNQFENTQKIEDDLLKAKEYGTLQIRDFDENSKNEFDQFIKNTAPHPAALSSAINTSGSEYAPVISANGKVIYFCGRNRDDNLGNEDIFISTRSNERWSPSGLMIDVNSVMSSEAPEAISVDGTQMLLFRSGRLCFSNRTATGWSDVEYLPEIINAADWQGDASISSDGKAMLFASRRENRIGFTNKECKKKGNLLLNEAYFKRASIITKV